MHTVSDLSFDVCSCATALQNSKTSGRFCKKSQKIEMTRHEIMVIFSAMLNNCLWQIKTISEIPPKKMRLNFFTLYFHISFQKVMLQVYKHFIWLSDICTYLFKKWLYMQSYVYQVLSLNIVLILWHTQLNVCAVK